MRTILYFFLILAWPLYSQQPTQYTIIKVDGIIINSTTGKELRPGDQIKSNDRLEFRNSYATAVAISDDKGKFTIRLPEQEDIFSDNKLLAMADNAISPVESRSQLSTRGVGLEEVKDLKNYLGSENFYIIGTRLSIKLNKGIYPLNEKQFIVFSYPGHEKSISKKIGFSGQYLNIERDKLVDSLGNLVQGKMLKDVSIYTFDKSKNLSSFQTKVNFVFLSEESLLEEFRVVVDVLKKSSTPKETAATYLSSYFWDVYGLTDQDVLAITIGKALKDY